MAVEITGAAPNNGGIPLGEDGGQRETRVKAIESLQGNDRRDHLTRHIPDSIRTPELIPKCQVSHLVTSPCGNTLNHGENMTVSQFAFTTSESGSYLNSRRYMKMDYHRESLRMLLAKWGKKDPSGMAESRLFIVTCLTAAIVGILTIAYTVFQWRRNISVSWTKAIARTKKKRKAKHKVPVASHSWSLESMSRGKSLNCCVCLKSTSPSQPLGPMAALDSFIPRCSICSAVAHLSCSSKAHKDCKCLSMIRKMAPKRMTSKKSKKGEAYSSSLVPEMIAPMDLDADMDEAGADSPLHSNAKHDFIVEPRVEAPQPGHGRGRPPCSTVLQGITRDRAVIRRESARKGEILES
ncbi:hypothetical protein HHK36_032300 [Tetracentron sinense]|uniref:Phorbol-ester/DAG-type domain-containing protein n=1 Tax=Tetracentron sinense TaxID=13715 RepID=A0A835D0J8_TETSI|nr:hypothetical protein HHK36_032300 [Tetracentron sinense]